MLRWPLPITGGLVEGAGHTCGKDGQRKTIGTTLTVGSGPDGPLKPERDLVVHNSPIYQLILVII